MTRGEKMNDTQKQKRKATGFRLFLKSAAWTLIAFSLIAIGFVGAELLFGSL